MNFPNSPNVVPFFTSRRQPMSILKRHMPFGSENIPCNPETPTSASNSASNSAATSASTSASNSTSTSASASKALTSVGQHYSSAERDKYTKMKLRKEAKKDRAERKAKTVITDGDRENYDIDKVLRTLGEVSNKIELRLHPTIYRSKTKPSFHLIAD